MEEGVVVVRGKRARREPSKASRRRCPVGFEEARRRDLPSLEKERWVQSGFRDAISEGVMEGRISKVAKGGLS